MINIENYKFNFQKCKNGHNRTNLSFEEFENTQKIDMASIKCNKCGKKKSETYKNELYKCIDCNIQICPICKSSHEANHKIMNYDNRNYLCNTHNDVLTKYCQDCNKNFA